MISIFVVDVMEESIGIIYVKMFKSFCIKDGEQILYLFDEEDDAMRYAMMLEDSGSPEMHVIEIEDEVMVKTCEIHDYKYTIITKNDLVIPPETAHDFI